MLDGDGKVASSGLHTNVHEIKQHTSGSVRSLLSIGHTSSNSLSRKKNGKDFMLNFTVLWLKLACQTSAARQPIYSYLT